MNPVSIDFQKLEGFQLHFPVLSFHLQRCSATDSLLLTHPFSRSWRTFRNRFHVNSSPALISLKKLFVDLLSLLEYGNSGSSNHPKDALFSSRFPFFFLSPSSTTNCMFSFRSCFLSLQLPRPVASLLERDRDLLLSLNSFRASLIMTTTTFPKG